MKQLLSLCVLAVIPLGLFVVLTMNRDLRGPTWSFDPSYCHYCGIVNRATGGDHGYWAHPGVTFQAYSVVIMRFVGWLREAPDVRADALVAPTMYIHVINASIFLAYACALLMLGVLTHRVSRSLVLALLIQVTPLCSVLMNINHLLVFSSYSFIAFSCALLSGVLIYALDERQSGSRVDIPLLLAVAYAFGFMTKVTFAPFALIPLVFLRGLLPRGIFLGATALLPALGTLFLRADYLKFWSNLLSNPQYDRTGSAGLFTHKFIASIGLICTRYDGVVVTVLLFGILVAVAVLAVGPWRRRMLPTSLYRALAGVTLALSVQVIMVARQMSPDGYSPEWLNPTRGMAGTVLCLAVWVLNEAVFAQRRYLWWIGYAVFGAGVAWCLKPQLGQLRKLCPKPLARDAYLAVQSELQSHYTNCLRVYYDDQGSAIFGVWRGMNDTATTGELGPAYRCLFPNTLIYWPWRNRLFSLDWKGLNWGVLCGSTSPVVFVGTVLDQMPKQEQPPVLLQQVFSAGNLAISVMVKQTNAAENAAQGATNTGINAP